MSSPTLTPNDLTRQQLDELDALLQRMLNLPLADAPSASPPPATISASPSIPSLPAGWRADPKASIPKAPYHATDEERFDELTDAAAPVAAMAGSRPAGSLNLFGLPPAQTARPFDRPPAETAGVPSAFPDPVPSGPLRGVDAPALPLGFSSFRNDPEPEPIPLVAAASEASTAEPAMVARVALSPVPLVHWPLYAINWLLETGLGLCGPLGSAVTHPVVKHVLGAAGILLLFGAAAWAARGMGWIVGNW